MANDHLVQLVRKGLAHGKTREELHESLCKGWAKEEVNAAFARVELDKYPYRMGTDDNFVRRQHTSSSPVVGILLIVLVFCFLFAGAYEGYTKLVQPMMPHASIRTAPSAESSLPSNSFMSKPVNEPLPFLHRTGDTPTSTDATSTEAAL